MNETTDAAAVLAPLWKRKWLILVVGVLVAVATYAYYKHQPTVYSATTQLDLGGGSEVQQLINGSPAKANLSTRALADVAALITSSSVTEAVQARLRKEGIHASTLSKVRAKAGSESDFVTITAEAPRAKTAVAMANGYAAAYVERQHLSYRREVDAAIANTRRQLHRIEAAQTAPSRTAAQTAPSRAAHGNASTGSASTGSAQSAVNGSAVIQAASLASKINQLESALSLSSVQQVNPAKPHSAQLISPAPRRNAIFGFVLGMLLAAVAVLALTRFDRRVRSLEQIEAIFKAQILAVLPRVREPIVQREAKPAPADALLEPLRRLHTSLQLGDMLEHQRDDSPRLILFLSPDAGDGKSTLVADLALVQRDAGARVAVIEADLRQPVQAALLSASAPRGLAEVLAGAVSLEGAMQSVGSASTQVTIDSEQPLGRVSTVAQSSQPGSLSVLAGGGAVANPPALLAGPAMQELLRSVAADFDYVLIDAPPPLAVSDAMPLLHAVDGIVIVARTDHTQEATAERLTRLLADSSTAPVLGVVANGVSRADIKRYGLSPAEHGWRWPRKPDR